MNIYKVPNSWNERETLTQSDLTAKPDWKKSDFSWGLKVDNLSREQMCASSEFQVDDAETENTWEVKLLVMPEGLAKRFVLQERKALNGR